MNIKNKRIIFVLAILIILLGEHYNDCFAGGLKSSKSNRYSSSSRKSKKIIDVPYINQDNIVYGCEAVSSTMVLRYLGYKISEKDFTDKCLIKKDLHTEKDGKIYGSDPNAAFPLHFRGILMCLPVLIVDLVVMRPLRLNP